MKHIPCNRYMAALIIVGMVFLADSGKAMNFKSLLVPGHWDNWCYFNNDTYYLYYLINSQKPGVLWDGFGVATSKDGVHWEDHGYALRASDKMTWYMGTGAIWKSPDFEKSGKFICNYSEYRQEPETGKRIQNIFFAWSTDLIHWTKFGDEHIFKIDPRYYSDAPDARWDCIYPMPRKEGGHWGTWTVSVKQEDPHKGTVGIGYSEDGLHWNALPTPEVSPGVAESGAFWQFGDRIYAMFGQGGMQTYVADRVEGPYQRQKKNWSTFAAGHSYFSRFFPLPDGRVLVNHQSNSDSGCYVAPLKEAYVDSEGTLRIKYWNGNEALKADVVPVAPQDPVTMMSGSEDLLTGVVAEGTLRLPAKDGDAPTGFYLLPENRGGHAIKIYHDGQVEFGPMDPFGGSWEPVLKVNREYKFGDTVGFRLLVRRGMVELYLDEQLIECYHMKGVGDSKRIRVGVLGSAKDLPVTGMQMWKMSLPGELVVEGAGTLQDKTLVAWVAPANLTQRGGSVLTIAARAGFDTPFDAIVFGELSPAKWMAGSDFWRRTKQQQDGWPAETANTPVQIAIVYRGNEITTFRNGEEYSRHTVQEPQSFDANSLVVIGPRIPGNLDFFAGTIDDARIYDRALTAEEIVALKPNVEGTIKPWAWWTFDDAAAKDRTGRFTDTQLTDGAKVENGHLVLDGQSAVFTATH